MHCHSPVLVLSVQSKTWTISLSSLAEWVQNSNFITPTGSWLDLKGRKYGPLDFTLRNLSYSSSIVFFVFVDFDLGKSPPTPPSTRSNFFDFLTKIKVCCFFNFKSLNATKIGSISLKLNFILFLRKKKVLIRPFQRNLYGFSIFLQLVQDLHFLVNTIKSRTVARLC